MLWADHAMTTPSAAEAAARDSQDLGDPGITVLPEEAGQRLDKLLAARLPDLSRSRLRSLIEANQVCQIGPQGAIVISDASHRVKPGAIYRVAVPPPEPPAPLGEDIALSVVHEDAHVIVIDKPAGLVVHPAAGHATGTLVNALIAHCGDSLSGIGGVKRPGIVHRLDKDTSGLLVVAKTDAAHKSLSEQFAAHGRDGRLHRAYLALVWGQPTPRVGRIEASLGRKMSNRTKMAVMRDEEQGRVAITHYDVVTGLPKGAIAPAVSLVRCVLETGRTHQVRVHMAHIGHPVLGDATYGAGFLSSVRKLPEAAATALNELGRQALHAAELTFEHPKSGRQMTFKSDLPADIARLLAILQAGSLS
jgi:23S rRNA pseudouridine1911/1915/1917 synthase